MLKRLFGFIFAITLALTPTATFADTAHGSGPGKNESGSYPMVACDMYQRVTITVTGYTQVIPIPAVGSVRLCSIHIWNNYGATAASSVNMAAGTGTNCGTGTTTGSGNVNFGGVETYAPGSGSNENFYMLPLPAGDAFCFNIASTGTPSVTIGVNYTYF